jgi:hypothetical protein
VVRTLFSNGPTRRGVVARKRRRPRRPADDEAAPAADAERVERIPASAGIRSDQGAELTANAVEEWPARLGVSTLHIEKASPRGNG